MTGRSAIFGMYETWLADLDRSAWAAPTTLRATFTGRLESRHRSSKRRELMAAYLKIFFMVGMAYASMKRQISPYEGPAA